MEMYFPYSPLGALIKLPYKVFPFDSGKGFCEEEMEFIRWSGKVI